LYVTADSTAPTNIDKFLRYVHTFTLATSVVFSACHDH